MEMEMEMETTTLYYLVHHYLHGRMVGYAQTTDTEADAVARAEAYLSTKPFGYSARVVRAIDVEGKAQYVTCGTTLFPPWTNSTAHEINQHY